MAARIIVAVFALLAAGCTAKLAVPAGGYCRVQLPALSMATRSALAGEIGQQAKQNPDAVIPGVIKDYLSLRASVRKACTEATGGADTVHS